MESIGDDGAEEFGLFLQSPQLVQVVLAHAAHQQIALVEDIVHEVVEKVEVLDLAGAGHMDPGTGAGMDRPTDGDVVFVQIGDGQVLPGSGRRPSPPAP